ncbi:hypothetical protein QYR58_01205 [Streptococcus iniae]|uniref:hypothetical protein n=1 Tax=Streptococcus iniae TaxID=1346 RepID=UPI002B32066C|nr:hypothetical protein QYR55_01830 [Streptococcus iniae]WNZ93280.1 hypothetical protein QYR58_01205 [Streptococcus iniae]
MSVVGEFFRGKTELNTVKKELDKALVTGVHAPRLKKDIGILVNSGDGDITAIAGSARSSITALALQLDTALKGQFKRKVDATIETTISHYDQF